MDQLKVFEQTYCVCMFCSGVYYKSKFGDKWQNLFVEKKNSHCLCGVML